MIAWEWLEVDRLLSTKIRAIQLAKIASLILSNISTMDKLTAD